MGTVATVGAYRAAQGRQQEAVQILQEAKKYFESLGGKVRIWLSGFGGERSGTLLIVTEYDSAAAMGAALDTIMAEMKNPTMRGVAEGVLVDQGRSILMEIG